MKIPALTGESLTNLARDASLKVPTLRELAERMKAELAGPHWTPEEETLS
jgi:hypothetical protein